MTALHTILGVVWLTCSICSFYMSAKMTTRFAKASFMVATMLHATMSGLEFTIAANLYTRAS